MSARSELLEMSAAEQAHLLRKLEALLSRNGFSDVAELGRALALGSVVLEPELGPLQTGMAQRSIETVSAGARTITQADGGKLLRFTGACVVTLPKGLTVGTEIGLLQAGTGAVTFAASSGASLVNVHGQTRMGGRGARCGLLVDAANSWVLSGVTASALGVTIGLG